MGDAEDDAARGLSQARYQAISRQRRGRQLAEELPAALRHASIETAYKLYSDIQAAETAEQVNELLDE